VIAMTRGPAIPDAPSQKVALRGLKEDSMDSDIARVLPAARNERWFDLCFRIALLALAGFWLLTPAPETEHRPAQIKAAQTTR